MTETRQQTAADYEKTIQVQASPEKVFEALTTTSGLSAWWTPATGSGEAGGELRFWMHATDPCVTRVDEATPAHSVRWTVTECAFEPDWVGTRPSFTITALGDGTSQLHFRHHGLTAELDCIERCISGWNHFIESLRQYVETGRGNPLDSPADQARRVRDGDTAE